VTTIIEVEVDNIKVMSGWFEFTFSVKVDGVLKIDKRTYENTYIVTKDPAVLEYCRNRLEKGGAVQLVLDMYVDGMF